MDTKEFVFLDGNELASLLGVERPRLTLDVKTSGFDGTRTLVSAEMFVDGHDLSPEHLEIAKRWLSERLKAQVISASKD